MPKRIISNADLVHLHNHTEYSSFDGLNRVLSDEIDGKVVRYGFPMLARKMGFKALACTDHGTIGGSVKFMQECYRKARDENGNELPPIKPIVGCEFYLSKNRFSHSTEEQPDGRQGNRHLLLLAKNWQGYKNLCALSQGSWHNTYYKDPRIDIELLARHSEGLMCSSACLSSVINANLLYDRYDQAKKAVAIFKDIFKDDFYLEAMYHGIDAEGMVIPDILKLGREMDIKVCATNDCHYGEQHAGPSHELLMAMSTQKCLTDHKHLHFPYHEFYLKSALDMSKHFGSNPEMLLNTVAVAEKINSEDIISNMKSGMRLPRYEIPEGFLSPHQYMESLAWEGAKKLGWDASLAHASRLKVEIEDIKIAWENNKYDFATYLLIVRDFIMEARKRNILTGCGRGSGYGSVLLRTLGITYGPDPLKYGLLWERFLGFDSKFFVQESDFGLDENKSVFDLVSETDDDDLEEDREVDDDLGGVDRY
jgi:DNA polymerase III subunit alpha